MFRTADGERRWAVLIVPLILCGAPLLAILVNRSLPGWGFLSFEARHILFLFLIPFVFGVVSETRPFMLGELEARDGYLVFAAIILIVWFFMLIEGWAVDFWANFLPFAVFFVEVGSFHAGRWVGRVPRRKLPEIPPEG